MSRRFHASRSYHVFEVVVFVHHYLSHVVYYFLHEHTAKFSVTIRNASLDGGVSDQIITFLEAYQAIFDAFAVRFKGLVAVLSEDGERLICFLNLDVGNTSPAHIEKEQLGTIFDKSDLKLDYLCLLKNGL